MIGYHHHLKTLNSLKNFTLYEDMIGD